MTVDLEYGLGEGDVIEALPVSVSAYAYNSNHAQEAADYLLSQFDNSPQLHSWVKALVKPCQSLEDMFNVLRSAFNPYTAVGDQLTRVGGIVNEERAGREDSTYRAYVLARIAVNNSDGLPADIYRVARILLGDEGGHLLQLVAYWPAGYILRITGAAAKYPWDAAVPAAVVATAMADLITQATSAGVRVTLHFQAADDAHTFTLAPADVEVVDANRGLGNDAETTGGLLSDYA